MWIVAEGYSARQPTLRGVCCERPPRPMLGLLCSLALFWTIIYAANKRRQGKSGGLPLPAYHTPRMQAAKYQVQLKPFHLIVETTAFNQIHDKFAWTLLRNPALKRVLKYFYGFGAALGVAGLLGGVGMLLWTTWKLSCLLLATSLPGGGLAKRDATVTPPRGSALPFYLIVSWSLPPMIRQLQFHRYPGSPPLSATSQFSCSLSFLVCVSTNLATP